MPDNWVILASITITGIFATFLIVLIIWVISDSKREQRDWEASLRLEQAADRISAARRQRSADQRVHDDA